MTIVPLVVAVPFLAATLIAIAGHWLPDDAVDVVAICAAVASTVLTAILVSRTAHRTVVYWFGGWRPKAGQFPLGISFTVDRFGAALALLACVLATAVLVYSWLYLREAHHLYQLLVLLFTGAMVGFVLSGDLFNMFVFFELMGVAAYALTAYQVEEEPALQAAFNFAVVNSIGAFLVVLGLALVYGRTGSLNLAELGLRLGTRRDGLVIVAFTLIICGFLVKSAIVPFHFWLADAYAAAPAPVCVLLAGVMSDLGLYAVGRVYWTAFDGPFGGLHHAVRAVLLGAGAATALLGAVMCVMQRHLKRLLAYATISELGCVLVGVALLTSDGAAGAGMTVVAHALAKASLFMACGVLLVVLGDVDELLLYGKGRRLPLVGIAWLLATVALASPPFLGTFSGHALIEDAADRLHEGWVAPVLVVSTILSTGSILRAGARVFLGVGTKEDPLLTQEPRESTGPREHPNVTLMTSVTLALAAAGLAAGAWTGLAASATAAAHAFVGHGAYLAAVLLHRPLQHGPAGRWVTTESSVVWAVISIAGTAGWAVLGLYRDRAPRVLVAAFTAALRPLKLVHTGHVGDYVAWLTFGVAALGGAFALALR